MDASVMFARMESESDDELISSIAPDVMTCLGRCSYFEKLDGLLSPEDNSAPVEKCDGSFRLSETILIAAGFDRAELKDIFAVLHSKGACCDCEVLYNVAGEEPPESDLLVRSGSRSDCTYSAHSTLPDQLDTGTHLGDNAVY
jgi:hypothetical protein